MSRLQRLIAQCARNAPEPRGLDAWRQARPSELDAGEALPRRRSAERQPLAQGR
ncbi:hypothetical protein [Stutzerimonas azotifigens]|uniref:Uncharacterized protein n=1 Tax=Stutzerimonas azotifigens TaxID=291995 RepID=A0ABR5YX25_9GAMM|nr:hypothetical protein [Stutzerimonas azotifigens]MBA1272491.1 hypothetical protein [Stutzerimonas azotifigens]